MIGDARVRRKLGRVLTTVARISITVVIFYVIAQKIDIAKALNFPLQEWRLLALSLLLAISLVFLQGSRWHFLLQAMGVHTDLRKDIKSVWAGHFLNNVLPTSAAGDVVRSYSLRFRGASLGQWVVALILEKLCAVATALALAAAMTAAAQLDGMPTAVKATVVIAFCAVLGAALPLAIVIRFGRNALPSRVIGFLDLLLALIISVPKNRCGRLALTTSLGINVGICLIFYGIVSAAGAQVSVMQCLFIVPVFTILAGLPISYGGWGVRELGGIHLLGYYGLSPELALSVTLLFGLTIFVSSLPGALVVRSFIHVLKRQSAS